MDLVGEILGYFAGTCTALCFLPQTLQIIRSRDVEGLSLTSYLIYSIGVFCWLLYGIYLPSIQIILFNVISLFFGTTILYMTYKYRR